MGNLNLGRSFVIMGVGGIGNEHVVNVRPTKASINTDDVNIFVKHLKKVAEENIGEIIEANLNPLGIDGCVYAWKLSADQKRFYKNNFLVDEKDSYRLDLIEASVSTPLFSYPMESEVIFLADADDLEKALGDIQTQESLLNVDSQKVLGGRSE